MQSNKERLGYLIIIFCASLLLRLGFILTLDQVYWEDENDYLQLAHSIADGKGYVDAHGNPTAFRPAGYPVFLSILIYLGFDDLFTIRMAQVFVSLLTIMIIYLYTKSIFGNRAAYFAAAMTAIYPYFVFIPGTLLDTTMYSFFLILACYCLYLGMAENKGYFFLASAVSFAICLLMRPSAGVLIAAAIFWIFKENKYRIGKALKPVLIYVSIILLCTLPWAYRNHQQVGVFSLSTNGGRNLWLGNNSQATPETGSNIELPESLSGEISLAANEAEIEEIYKREAWSFMLSDWMRFVKLAIQKGAALWRFDPSPTTEGYIRTGRTVKWLGIMSYGPILVFAIIGFIHANEQRKQMVLWLLFAAAYTAVHAVVISKVRFRLPLDHFLIMSAAFALCHAKAIAHAVVEKTHIKIFLNRLHMKMANYVLSQ